MNYREAIQYLYSLGHETLAMKLGLEGIRALARAFDDPPRRYAVAHIAGTNGKGSTAAMTAAIARAAGLRAGLYTSPHLSEITERIRVHGEKIAPEDFARLATGVRAKCEQLVTAGALAAPLTFFEQVTMIAFLYFAERRVELAVLEVGLGGRLDATNICAPLATAITPVALDHQQYLGDTLAAIAGEKAGIIKPEVPVVVAPQEPEAMTVIAEQCARLNAPLIRVQAPRDLELIGGEAEASQPSAALMSAGLYRFRYRAARAEYDVRLNLRGRHQAINACAAIHLAEQLAERGLNLPARAIATGLSRVEWPGRLELIAATEPPLLLDGAHNPAGARSLRAFLDEHCPVPVTLIFGVMADKDIAELAAILFPAASVVIAVGIANERAASAALIAASAPGVGYQLICAGSAIEALAEAQRATPPGGVICVCGSLYLIGEIKRALKEEAKSAPERLGH
jgi:dihydrofolate synthase/folylpolyglutamate synthase